MQMRKALLTLCFGALALTAATGYAQSDSGATGTIDTTGGANGARGEKMRERFEARFNKADANGDGKLSKSEAAAMPRVAKNFDAIDADHDGFVSKAEIAQAMMAKRGAAKGGSQ